MKKEFNGMSQFLGGYMHDFKILIEITRIMLKN